MFTLGCVDDNNVILVSTDIVTLRMRFNKNKNKLIQFDVEE